MYRPDGDNDDYDDGYDDGPDVCRNWIPRKIFGSVAHDRVLKNTSTDRKAKGMCPLKKTSNREQISSRKGAKFSQCYFC